MASASACRPPAVSACWPAAAPRAANAYRLDGFGEIETPIVPASGATGRETMQSDPTEPGDVTPDAAAPRSAAPSVARRSSKRDLVTLKKRPEFLRLRGGRRWACPAFAIETKPSLQVAPASGPRFGFTVTKAMGNAVARNRIRRRLKAAVTEAGVPLGHADHDYVLIARSDAGSLPYTDLCQLVATALRRLHEPEPKRGPRRQQPPPPPQKSKG